MFEAFWPYGGMFAAALLASSIVPFSSDVVLAGLVSAGKADVYGLLFWATLGNSLGATLNWALGKYLHRYRERSWYPISPQSQARAEHWFNRFGVWSLLFSWLPVIGDPLTLIAGVLRVRLLPFLLLVVTGKAARYALIAYGTLQI